MLEKVIEAYLVQKVKELGGIAYKFTSPQRRSVPDRLCLFPYGLMVFVEVKAPKRLPTEAQAREILRLQVMGFSAITVSSKEQVYDFIEWVKTKIEEEKLCRQTHEGLKRCQTTVPGVEGSSLPSK